MELKFDSNLEYQENAIKSVVDLFKGQNELEGYFTVTGQTGLFDKGIGIGNKLDISDEDIFRNLREVQKSNKLSLSSRELSKSNIFNIEMETGTGKTYVYLRTIFELNKKYGLSKFVIVVPNIAIKEGVKKTLDITKSHFKEIYEGVLYDYFIYDSGEMHQIRNFATENKIQIMIINIASFNKDFGEESNQTNIIKRPNERLEGRIPIDLIAETQPVVIIDEPQSIGDTNTSKKAIASLNPLFTLKYSATHKEMDNLIYKLSAVDAYEMGLVKQIEVLSVQAQNNFNLPYMKLISTNPNGSNSSARIKVNYNKDSEHKRKTISVKKESNLFELTGFDYYEGYIVDEINSIPGSEFISFTNGEILRLDISNDDVEDDIIKRAQISKTIEEHLNKQLELKDKGIKVLSLFFIDNVDNYRKYDKEYNPIKGKYAVMFEEEYERIINLSKYESLKTEVPIDKIHDGYFSIDRKGRGTNKKEIYKNTRGFSKKYDNETYELIMKKKEELLSFSSDLQFIFSHSALKEGWDNPNVFQICTLKTSSSSITKRQEIGRGLRLCVNQDGDRIKDDSINILTVMANESYDEFTKALQKELEEEGFKFGSISENEFSYLEIKNKNGKMEFIDEVGSKEIFNHFIKEEYINSKGKIQPSLKNAVEDDMLSLPEKFEFLKKEIINHLENKIADFPTSDRNERKRIEVNTELLKSRNFVEFWEKINGKTTFSVDFDSEELINKCVKCLNKEIQDVQAPCLLYQKSSIELTDGGVRGIEGQLDSDELVDLELPLPDIVTEIQKKSFLTRKTIVTILKRTDSLELFKKNPQEYITEVLKIIKRELNKLIFDNITYRKTDNFYTIDEFYKESYGYSSKLVETNGNKSIYNHIKYESDIERKFIEDLEKNDEVKLYTKLPDWFVINTPIGKYNPDWAILYEKENIEKLYYVIETKGSEDQDDLRIKENYKIKSGKKHFEALNTDVVFDFTKNYHGFVTKIVR